jgi:hypothetical protein
VLNSWLKTTDKTKEENNLTFWMMMNLEDRYSFLVVKDVLIVLANLIIILIGIYLPYIYSYSNWNISTL